MPAPIAPLFGSKEQNAALAQKQADDDVLVKLSQQIQSIIDHPGQFWGPNTLGLPDPYAPKGPSTSDVAGAILREGGEWIDRWMKDKAVDFVPTTGAIGTAVPVVRDRQPTDRTYADAFEQVGRTLPRATVDVALAATGVGLPVALFDAFLQGYEQDRNPMQGAVSAATMLTGAKLIPSAGRAGEQMAARAFQPAFQDLVQAAPQQYGTQVARMLAPNKLAENVIAGSRIAAEGVAGTGLGEASRQVSSVVAGQGLQPIDPIEMAANVVQNLAFAPLDVVGRIEPATVRTQAAMETVKRADIARQKLAQLNDSRGQRIATAHRAIFEAVDRGEDPSALIAELKSHWIEADAARGTNAEEAGRILMAMADEGNAGRLSELDLAQIINGVQGRFDRLAEADPESTTPGTVSGRAIAQMVDQGLLPKITEQWIKDNFAEAYEQMLGDESGARANLVNRIVAAYQEAIPGALETRSKMPKPEELTKKTLDAKLEADKDTAYIQALLKLWPAMKGKSAPDGSKLDEAFLKRDALMSAETQGGQLAFESRAWSRYDTWKDQIIAFAETYDPTTRRGLWVPSRRMADQTVIRGEPVAMTIEELVDYEPLAKGRRRYKVQSAVGRKQLVGKQSLLDRMMEYADAQFSRAEDDPDVALGERRPDERTRETRAGKVGALPEESGSVSERNIPMPENLLGADWKPDEKTAPEVAAAWREATEVGLRGEDRVAYVKKQVEQMRDVDSPALGVDISQNETALDAAIQIVNKIEKTDADTLWREYGGTKVFGPRSVLTPGKRELFKDALLAKIEYDADPTGKSLSETQKRFVTEWKKFAARGEEVAMPESFRDWKEATRHALRLYWGSVSHEQVQQLFKSFIADKPQYAKLLEQRTVQSEPVELPDGNPLYSQTYGMRDPITDSLRLFRGFAKRQGFDDGWAEDYATIASKMVQAFDETGGVARQMGGSSWGVNIPAGLIGPKPLVAVNFDNIAAHEVGGITQSVRALQILAHELAHNYGLGTDGHYTSAYRQQRVDAMAKLQGLFKELGPEATDELLNNVVQDVFIPPGYRPKYLTDITKGNFEEEAVSKLMEYIMLGAFTKNSPWQTVVKQKAKTFDEAFEWLPEEIQGFTRLAFRDITNFVGGLKDYFKWFKTPEAKKTVAYLQPMMDFANDFLAGSVKKSMEYETIGRRTLAGLQASGSVLWDDPLIVRTNKALDFETLQEIAGRDRLAFSEMKRADDPFGFEEMQMNLFGKNDAKKPGKFMTEEEARLGARTPKWSHWLGLLYQNLRRYEKAGVRLAEPAARMLSDLEPAYWRLTQSLHRPFIVTKPNGDISYDPNHPVQQILQNKHPQAKRAYRAMRDLALWMQEYRKPVFGPDGQLTQDAQAQFAKRLNGLDATAQQGVIEGLKGLVQGYKEAADLKYNSTVQTISANVAKFFMVADKGMYWDVAFNHARSAVDGAIVKFRAENDVAKAQQALSKITERAKTQPELLQSPELANAQQAVAAAQQQLQQAQAVYRESLTGLSPEQVAVMEQYVAGVDGPVMKLYQMSELFKRHEGWYMSEARPGRYLIFAKTPDGEQYTSSRDTRNAAELASKKLVQDGYTDISVSDRDAADPKRLFDSPDETVNSFIQLEQGAWQRFLKTMEGKLSEEDFAFLQQFDYTPGAASQRFVTNRSIEKYMNERKLTRGREELNPFEVFTDYTRRMVGNVSRRGLREQMELLLRDPRARTQGEFQRTVREAMDTLMQPVDSRFMTARTAINAFYLGLPNIASPIVESSQALTTVFPALVNESKSFTEAVKLFTNAPVNIYKYHNAFETLAGKRLLQSAKTKETIDPRAMTKEESLAYYYRRSLDERRFHQTPIDAGLVTKDYNILTQYAFGMGLGDVAPASKAKLAESAVYWASQTLMWPYAQLSALNNRVAFMAGLEHYYDQGLRGVELYQKAHLFKDIATFGGGKANEIGYVGKLSNPRTRSWFSIVNTLQRYAFGNMTMLKDYAADVIGRTDLPPRDRVAAGKALTTALSAQVVLAGAIGLPGAAIAAALMQELFKVDAKQKAREFWYELGQAIGLDKPEAVMLANVAQNGVGGQFMGMDLSSRLSVNTFLGFDAYEGFNAGNLIGAGGGIIEGMINATKYVADGKMVKAGTAIAPPSWRPLIDIATQDGPTAMRDASGRMIFEMTPGEKIRYAAGIRPYRYRLFRDQQAALKNAQESYATVRDQRVDEAAEALSQGNPQTAFDWIREVVQQSPTVDQQALKRAVVDRTLTRNNAVDLLSQTPTGTADRSREIAESFGNAVPRQSEVDLLIQRQKLNAQVGLPLAGGDEVTRAALVDALVKQRGMTRSEAVRLVTLLGY